MIDLPLTHSLTQFCPAALARATAINASGATPSPLAFCVDAMAAMGFRNAAPAEDGKSE